MQAAAAIPTAQGASGSRGFRALPDWSAVPSNSEEDRLLFSARLAFFGKVHFLMSAGFLFLQNVIIWSFESNLADLVAELRRPSSTGHMAAFTIAAGQWWLCRKGRLSPRALNVLDAGGLVAMMIAYGCMPFGRVIEDPGPILTIVMVSQAVVVLHAIVIPGTGRRNFWVSVAACVPVLISVYVFTPRPHTLPATMNTGLWVGIIVATSTLASGVIHGLQQRVRDAAEVGQYTLEEKIGEGGMGVVYRARHVFLRRPTAVKLLPPTRAGAETLARFEREVQQTSRLTHPNTVAIYDYGHTADGVFYYAMEFLDGVSLEQLVQHDGPQPPGRVVHILRQVCGALAEAHDAGLIHRDVKPANLLLCVRGGIPDLVKVLDFGLVKELGNDSPELSTAGAFVGTPLYISPEAISRPAEVDARSDLYALGAVAYFLLTATPPFGGATLVEVCSKHLHTPPEPPSARLGRPLAPALEALVLRCLAKRPDDRPPSAAALVEALDGCAVPPWTDAAARAWWAARGATIKEALAQGRHGQGSTGDGQRTVIVDLGERAS